MSLILDQLNTHLITPKKYIANNTLWLALEKATRGIINLLIGAAIARVFGANIFGFFALLQGIFFMLFSLGKNASDSLISRGLSKSNTPIEIQGCLLFRVSGYIIISIVILIFTFSLQIENWEIQLILGILVYNIFSITLFFDGVILYERKAYIFSTILSFGYIIFGLLKFWILTSTSSLLLLACTIAAEGATIYTAYGIAALKFLDFKFKLKLSFRDLGSPWREYFPLFLSGVAVLLYMRIDQLMITFLLGSEENGIYVSAVRISEIWYIIPAVIANGLFPTIVDKKNESNKDYSSFISKLYCFMFWGSVIFAITFGYFSELLISFLYGNSFSSAASVTRIHLFTIPVVSSGLVFSKWLICEGMSQKALPRTIFGLISNLLLNYPLILHFGIEGAAFATLASQVFANFVYDFFDKDVKAGQTVKLRSIIFQNLK